MIAVSPPSGLPFVLMVAERVFLGLRTFVLCPTVPPQNCTAQDNLSTLDTVSGFIG